MEKQNTWYKIEELAKRLPFTHTEHRTQEDPDPDMTIYSTTRVLLYVPGLKRDSYSDNALIVGRYCQTNWSDDTISYTIDAIDEVFEIEALKKAGAIWTYLPVVPAM